MKFYNFIVGSIIIHLIQFVSIFDIYFTSPIVTNIEPEVKKRNSSLADRLVLFVGDGLRADTLYSLQNDETSRAPFLRNIIENSGSWGISHTHIPTETRPGMVAIIAGFYEDVSAVMNGWKENPVEFDSVFNKSRETWAWGHPETIGMFSKGMKDDHMHTTHYATEYDSLTDQNAVKLDRWVFDKVTKLFESAKHDEVVDKKLRQDKIVFFLHLLGLDTNGHSYKPKSHQYQHNLRIVDEGIKNITQLFDEFFNNDDRTTFIFTSDHGMTDWGSHGASDSTETETPLLAWGASISKGAGKKDHNLGRENHGVSDETIKGEWKLDPTKRMDVEQADIAPLMSAMINVPYPVNSVGLLPVNYLSCSDEEKAFLLSKNAKQIGKQFVAKKKRAKGKVADWIFTSFPRLTDSDYTTRLEKIHLLASQKNFVESMQQSEELIFLSLEGIRYYHTYHRFFLYICVTLSSVGWIVVSCILVVKELEFVASQCKKRHLNLPIKSFFITLGLLVICITTLFDFRWTVYIYCLLPCAIWYAITTELNVITTVLKMLNKSPIVSKKLVIYFIVGIFGVWSLVGCFFYRYILSMELIIFAVIPIFAHYIPNHIKVYWSSLCTILSAFPALPVVGANPPKMYIVLLSGLFVTSSCYVINRTTTLDNFTSASYKMPIIASVVAFITSQMSTDFGDVHWLIHFISWTLMLSFPIAPLCSSTSFPGRLLLLYSWLSTAYILLCLSYDALFFGVFFCLLYTWIHLEYHILSHEIKSSEKLQNMDFCQSTLLIGSENSKVREPNFCDIRRSYMLVFFMVLAFFGVGNIASINSFDVRVVFPFLTVFNMFVMVGLLACKVVLPYLLLVCSFSAVAMATQIPFKTICAIVMVISDFMALHFLFMVRDDGSWLEIGTSISHFVIVMSMNLALLFFFVAANFLTTAKINIRVSNNSSQYPFNSFAK